MTPIPILAALALAATAPTDLAVPDYGKPASVTDAHERPDPGRDYKVVFDVSRAGTAGKPNGSLDRVARLVNMLARGGVGLPRRHIVVVVHGPATEALLSGPAYSKRHAGSANPDGELVAELQRAGVQFRVCGQALAGQGVEQSELAAGVQVDLAAVITTVHLQMDGYALVEG